MADQGGGKWQEAAGSEDDLLASKLAGGSTYAEAAKAAGCSERTVYRRLADPSFKALVASYRAAIIDQAFGVLAQSSADAFAVFKKLLKDKDARIALAAAGKIGDLLVKVGSFQELERQVAELRAEVAESRVKT